MAAMKVRLAVLAAYMAIALSCDIAPADAGNLEVSSSHRASTTQENIYTQQNIHLLPAQTDEQADKQTDNPIQEQPFASTIETDRHSLPTSNRALNFSLSSSHFFAQQDTPRQNPYQIISAVRKKHRQAAQNSSTENISTQERIYLLKKQLPQQLKQARSKVDQLPSRIRNYTWQAKITTLVVAAKGQFYQTKESIKELAINILEKASKQTHQAAESLKQ